MVGLGDPASDTLPPPPCHPAPAGDWQAPDRRGPSRRGGAARLPRGSGVQGAGTGHSRQASALRFAGGKNEWLRLRRAAGSIPAVFVSRSLPQCHHAIDPHRPETSSREPSGHTTANSSDRAGRSQPEVHGCRPGREKPSDEPTTRTRHYPAGPDRDHRAHGIPIESGVHGRVPRPSCRDWLRRCGRAGLARRWRSRAGRAPHRHPRPRTPAPARP